MSQVKQSVSPLEPDWSKKELESIELQVHQLLQKGAIQECNPEREQFVSRIFLTPKTDGSFRLILNLKKLNEFVKTEHFKLEDRKVVKKLVSQNCFMATIDLKDAYYLIPIADSDKRF
jgi:hypothetical protein